MGESKENKAPTLKKKHKIWNIISRSLGIALWVALIVLCIINRDKISADGIVGLFPKNSWVSVVVMLCLFALKSVSVVVYIGVLYAASGILFSLPIAILINVIGTAITVSIPFFIGKKAGASLIGHLTEKHPKLTVIQEFSHQNDFLISFLLRMIGFLPGDIVCMYLGASQLNFIHYLIGSILGSMSAIISFAIMGMSANDITSPAFLISLGVELFLMAASVVFGIIWNLKKKNKTEKK